MNLRTLLVLLAAIGALIVGVWVSWQQSQQIQPRPQVSALWLQQPRSLAAVTLTDNNGQPFGQQQLAGKWTLMFVGYTSCPDVCPTTMSDLARLYPRVAQLDLQVVLLSVDPQRDQPSKLNSYVQFFNPNFKAVTGPHTELYPFTQSLGLVYALVDSPSGSDYLVDHSADIVLINPQGQLEAIFRPQGELGQVRTVSMQDLAQDLPNITAYVGG
ncbi:SCO family protein [Ferrimonas lipolytica]|uniref:SCO family protein n=1 Tax=Ferrimonas lipolytica TaxID=2724191 RepID=A0A6H1UH10_9GAMM|nr:SCO family protein [Ferrimonas lipolytica]QIZ78395.1 SCO family protein [Ferrimonas lipolytica]